MLPKGSDVMHQLIYHSSYISSHVYNSILNLSPTPFRPKANKVPMPTILFLNSIEIQCPSGECVKLWTLYQPILAIGHIGAITCLSYIYIYIEWIDYSTKLTVQHALHQTIWNMTKLDLIILYWVDDTGIQFLWSLSWQNILANPYFVDPGGDSSFGEK